MKTILGILLVAMGISTGAQAEINITQDQAIEGNVTAGDAAGFPITISQPGSYRLSSDLYVTDADVSAIEIKSNHVSIDLNGHAIIGPQHCDGWARAECKKWGTTAGITSTNLNNRVYNGTVTGFHYGLLLGQNAYVEKIIATQNVFIGIRTTLYGIIKNCQANLNGSIGIETNWFSSVMGSAANGNGDSGIWAGRGNIVKENTASYNGQYGIHTAKGEVINNVANLNDGTGIYVSSANRLYGNTTIENNIGIRLDGGSYGSNVSSDNKQTNVQHYGSADQLSTNSCNGSPCEN